MPVSRHILRSRPVALLCSTAIAASLQCAIPSPAHAQIWTGALSDDWFDPGNWAGGTVPVTGAYVEIETVVPNAPVIGGDAGSVDWVLPGRYGTGSLTIVNGGTLDTLRLRLGNDPGSVGSVEVRGQNSALGVDVDLLIGASSTGSLSVTAGGQLNSAGYSAIAYDAGSQGNALVTGAGSLWSHTNTLMLAQGGAGALTVADGGRVTASAILIAMNAPSVGTLNIGGPAGGPAAAAGIVDTASVSFGAGNGTINFNHTDNSYIFAPAITGAGTVNFLAGTTILTATNTWTGPTTVATGASLQIGNGGMTGTISSDVTNNGQVTFNRAGNVTYAGEITGDGSLTKIGAGTLTLTGDSDLAGNLTVNGGVLSLANGGSVSNYRGHIGAASGTVGEVVVSGSDASWNLSSHLYVGDEGSGTLRIANGAEVSNLTGTIGLGGGTGSVTISGADSTWVNSANIFVGQNGEGHLTIEAGGTAEASAAITFGVFAGASGVGEVTGEDSRLATNQNIYVGNGGGGTLTIADRAEVSGSTIAIGYFAGASGTINIGAAAGDGPVAAGRLNTPTIEFRDGNGALVFNHTDTDYVVSAALASMGGATHAIRHLAGSTLLTGDSSLFAGTTTVSGGTLLVGNGAGSGHLGGTIAVQSGGTLGGSGTVGTTTVASGGRIAPGNSIGTLTVSGNLTLSAGSILDYELGAPGASAALGTSDRIDVSGNLTIDGTLNLSQSGAPADGSAGLGYYRLLTYGGTLTDNGLEIGTTPTLADPGLFEIQAGGGNVDLFIGTAGLDTLQHWQGGDGVWNATNAQWLNDGSTILVPWASNHGVFKNEPGGFDGGTITVEGAQSFKGLQFVDSGYRLNGSGQLVVDGSDSADGNAEIRVLVGETAEIAATITGAAGLTKTQGGTLVLQGDNSYQGGTRVTGGTVSVASDANLGDVSGWLVLDDGTLHTTAAFTTDRAIELGAGGGTVRADAGLTMSGVISGSGALIKTGGETLLLTGANSYGGGTTISAGTVMAAATGALGDGPVNVGPGGQVGFASDASAESLNITLDSATMRFDDNASAGTATIANRRSAINFYDTTSADGARITNDGGGTSFNNASSAGNAIISAGGGGSVGFYGTATAGSATLTNTAAGAVRFYGSSTASNARIINQAGGLVEIAGLAAGGVAVGSLSGDGDIELGSKALTLGGLGLSDAIGGDIRDGTLATGGSLIKTGAGTLTLNGANSYTGQTTVQAGTLIVGDGGHASAALAGNVNVGTSGTLGGSGTIGGDVVVDGTLAAGNSPGTLTILGDLALSAGSRLDYELGQAGVVGGPLNDLVVVGGDLTLGGTVDVTVPAGGAFDIGVYRLFDYGGTLIDNGLTLGIMPPESAVTVQTAIAGQINLVNAGIERLYFWDGAAGPRNDGVIAGGDGVWQNTSGNDNWTGETGDVNSAYGSNAFAIFGGTGGTVTVDGSLGAVVANGMQFHADGYTVAGDTLVLSGPESTIRVGDGTAAGAQMAATIQSELAGDTRLVKTDAGTLVLAGTNSYTGGTSINGGILSIASDANLGDAAGDVALGGGGALATSADLSSARSIVLVGAGAIRTAENTTFTHDGQFAGVGTLVKDGAGRLLVSADNDAFAGDLRVAAGTLAVTGGLASAVDVAAAGRLEGTGRVGSVTNAGVVAPGLSIGTLTVAGDYVGTGGTLEVEAALGGDTSPADLLVIDGATSGNTLVAVTNAGGLGALTVEGIRIVEVGGASNGSFTLVGDYALAGEQVVIAGAYGYRLYQNGIADPQDGDWYLRSALPNGAPIYQPGVPVYEAYMGALQALNTLPTLQQRVGNRSWAAAPTAAGTGIWGRMEGKRLRPEAAFSTSGADRAVDSWQMQMGVDTTLHQRADGATLIGALTAHYGMADSKVASPFGNGTIDTKGYGFGATLTWYGPKGFYVDGQAKVSWFESDLESGVLGSLADGNDGTGQAYSLEVGKRTRVGRGLTITPQVQMSYADVDFDSFIDPVGAAVSADRGDSLKTRWGLSLDHQTSRESASGMHSTHLYSVVNLSYEWLEGALTDVSGTPIAHRDRRLWTELGLGGTYSWGDGRFALFAEVSGETAVADFGDSYSVKGNAGFRARF